MMTMSMTTMRTRKAFIISQKFLKPSFRVGSKVKKSKKKKSKNVNNEKTKRFFQLPTVSPDSDSYRRVRFINSKIETYISIRFFKMLLNEIEPLSH